MARFLAQRKPQTAEEACERAFKRWYYRHISALAEAGYGSEELEIGWKACWHYLEKQAVKEFIER